MAFRIARSILHGSKNRKVNRAWHMNIAALHHGQESLPSEWYNKAYKKLTRLTKVLEKYDMIDGRLVNITDSTTTYDENLVQNMLTFKAFTRVFLGGPSAQSKLQKYSKGIALPLFSKPNEREPIVFDSLTKICNLLNISVQHRKDVRLKICPQVTQHQIWTAALFDILKELKSEMDCVDHMRKEASTMSRQIVVNCLKVLDDAVSFDPDLTSWMRLGPKKIADSANNSQHKWEDVYDMFNDLINCLKFEKVLLSHVRKLEVMKEGLAQIKDVSLDKSIGYKDIRHQESLVQKKLSKTLGHSSKCLFTLVNYYLYSSVHDIEADLCGGIHLLGDNEKNNDKSEFSLCMGKILTSGDEKMVSSGVKELNKALGVCKFVWEAAGMKGVIHLQGHLWYFGCENRSITYRENTFYLHGISH